MFPNGYFGWLVPSTGGITPPPSPAQVTGLANVWDEIGTAENGVKVYTQMIFPPPTMGNVYDNTIKEWVSSGGLVQITGLFKGATYFIWRGRSDKFRIKIPPTATHPYNLSPILGNESTDPCLS